MRVTQSIQEIERQINALFINYEVDPFSAISLRSFADVIADAVDCIFKIEVVIYNILDHNSHEIAIYIKALLQRREEILYKLQA